MKTIIKALVLPVAAFALASAGAVSTSQTTVSKTAKPPMIAFIHDPLTTSCRQVDVVCNPQSGPICTYSEVGGVTWQAFRKLTPTGPCNQLLFFDQQ